MVSSCIARETKDDGEEKMTFELHIHDIVSQKHAYVSEPKLMLIFSLMFGLPMPSLIYDDIMRFIMLVGLLEIFLERIQACFIE